MMKLDDETSSVADDLRDMHQEHMSTPSPDTSDYNSENEVDGSSVAEEENGAPVDDVDDDDDDDDDDGDDNDNDDDDDDDEVNETNCLRADSAAGHMPQVQLALSICTSVFCQLCAFTFGLVGKSLRFYPQFQ